MVEFLENPKWRVAAEVSDCGKYLLVFPQQDCRDNLVFFADVSEQMKNGFNSKLVLTPVVSKYEADYDVSTYMYVYSILSDWYFTVMFYAVPFLSC